jgi:aspartyl-tRNA(Asn)/glutamyl-tRNA(Gln) amidotransferase subunit A
MIGKTTLDELAMGGTGTTGHLGKTYNPYDPKHERMIGGSSCGSAAAVSASIAPFALGSDTGDSVRKPACYAGLVGMKPTWGRISRYGLFPFAPSLDHVGYFTRDVYASAVLLDVLAGRDNHDATSSTKPVEHYEEDLNKPVKGMKVAVLKMVTDSVKDEEIKKHFYASLEALKERRGRGRLCRIRQGSSSNRSTRLTSSSAALRRPRTTPTSMGSSLVPIRVARPIRKSCSTPGRRALAN